MRIGVTASISKTQFYVNQAYVEYIAEAGYEPVLITPENDPKNITAICDGLLLPGGIDIEPTFYGENNIASNGVDSYKDDFEREVFHAFLAAKKPVFGICRGFQLIIREFNRFYGHIQINKHRVDDLFSYYQHVSGHSMVNDRNLSRTTPSHAVNYRPSLLYAGDKADWESMFVNSIHHQCIIMDVFKGRPAHVIVDEENQLQPAAKTKFQMPHKIAGYIVEGVDGLFNGVPVRAVQWHPEELLDTALLHAFFEGKNDKEMQENG